MEIAFTDQAVKDIQYWKSKKNKLIQERIEKLLESICQSPSEGIGKPERLKYDLAGCWSRRINNEHRIVYTVSGEIITIISVRFHY